MDSSSLTGVLALAACLLFILIATYFLLRSRMGAALARNLIFQEIALLSTVAVVLFVAVSFLANSGNLETGRIVGFLIGTIGLVASLLTMLLNRPTQKEIILLDLGKLTLLPAWFIKLWVIGSGLVVVLSLFIPERRLGDVLATIFSFTFALWALIQDRERRLVTEKGIWLGQAYLKWEQIGVYSWANRQHEMDTLIIRLRRRPPFFNTSYISVPLEHKNAMAELLARYVPDMPG